MTESVFLTRLAVGIAILPMHKTTLDLQYKLNSLVHVFDIHQTYAQISETACKLTTAGRQQWLSGGSIKRVGAY